MHNCHKFSNWFSEYIDSELAADKSMLLKAHLEKCEFCRLRFDGVTALRQNLKGLAHTKASKSFDAVFQNRLHREKRKASRRFSGFSFFESSYWRLPAYAAAAVLFIFIGAQLQKYAFLRQFDQSRSIVFTLKNSAGEPSHMVVARIDSAENRIHLTNYGNNTVERAASSPTFYMTEKELLDLRRANLPVLPKASDFRVSDFGRIPSARDQPRITSVSSQYQF